MNKKYLKLDRNLDTKTISLRIPMVTWNFLTSSLDKRTVFPSNASDNIKIIYAIRLACESLNSKHQG